MSIQIICTSATSCDNPITNKPQCSTGNNHLHTVQKCTPLIPRQVRTRSEKKAALKMLSFAIQLERDVKPFIVRGTAIWQTHSIHLWKAD